MSIKRTVFLLAIASLLLTGCGANKKTHQGQTGGGQVVEPDTSGNEISVPDKSESGEHAVIADVPFTAVDLFIQPHLVSDFDSYEADETFFLPVGRDYFMGSFVADETLLYSYDFGGNLIDAKRRVVYASKDALLAANSEKNLEEDVWSEDGYTYHDNVLYARLSDEGLFVVESSSYKYLLLKKAAAGLFDKEETLYYFSIPYRPDESEMGLYEDIFEDEEMIFEET